VKARSRMAIDEIVLDDRIRESKARMHKIVEVQNISKTFTAKGKLLRALESIDLTLYEEEFVSFIGPSGCGKTTLLNLIGGLEVPSSGEIRVDGELVRGPLPTKIGIVFQEYSLLPWRNVLGNIQLGLEFRGVEEQERTNIAREHAGIVGLSKFLHFYPHELSGGMKQRVAMARSLALGCKLLLMDEPFGALDEQTRTHMGEELIRIQQNVRSIILFVTHSILEAITLSDRIVVMGAQPGTILDIIGVEFPRPRTAEIRKSPEFNELREQVWDLLSFQWDRDSVG
jgi:NitT/TauT family transport system ATP-binding protein